MITNEKQFSLTRAASDFSSRLSALASNATRCLAVRSCLLVALCLAVATNALGEKLEDFKDAASQTGVASIPFKDLREKAERLEKVKEERKTLATSPEIELLTRQKETYFAQIKTLKVDLDAEIDHLAKFKSDDGFILAEMSKEIDQAMKKCVEIEQGAIAKFNDKMTKYADACAQFAQARADVRECFNSVKEKLSDAKSHPESYLDSGASDDDKKQLSGYIDKIKAGIESEEGEHKSQEDGSREKAAQLKALIDRTE